MRKIWDIPGGIHPPENKTQTNTTPIESVALPAEIVLPLSQHIGAPARTIVEVGSTVLKGQKIADPEGPVSAPVHASTSGTVIAIEERPIAHPSGLNATCIVIKPDGNDTWCSLEPCEDFRTQDTSFLAEKIREAGIAGMGGAGFPTAVKIQPRANQTIDTLILNGTECEPYITADDVLMREKANEIVAGAEILGYILGNPDIIIGIEDNKPEAIKAVQAAVEGKNIEVAVFPTKYPSGGEKQLIHILTGKEVPSGGLPSQIGIVVQNVGTAAAVYRAIVHGEPLISRVTTIVGQSLQKQGNVNTLIGTPIQHLLDLYGYNDSLNDRLVIGGPMMGFTVENPAAPVVKTTNCLLAPTPQELPPPELPRPCIRCSMCSEVCPSTLLPQQLFWYSQAEDFDALEAYNLFDCIECGACSYVCPSDLPLVQYYRASKGTIRQLKEEKENSDRSRLRFENRKDRIARAEAEKEAKRQARKVAAEKAKQQLAEKPAQATPTAKPASAPVDPEKLERAVVSARLRVEAAQQKLSEAEAEKQSEARLSALRARIKQAEQKLKEAEAKITEAETKPAAETKEPFSESSVIDKIQASPVEKLEKSVASIKKRLATAEQKLAEAEASENSTVEALRTGVEKLKEKLATAEKEREDARQLPAANEKQGTSETLSAADLAIAKAQQKAAKMAEMSDEEKQAANLASLETRLSKAKERLAKAEAENSEHIEAFRSGVTKLEDKLAQAKNTLSTAE